MDTKKSKQAQLRWRQFGNQLLVLLYFLMHYHQLLDAPRVQNTAHTTGVRMLCLAALTSAQEKCKDWVEDPALGSIWPRCNAQGAAGKAVLGKGWSTLVEEDKAGQ